MLQINVLREITPLRAYETVFHMRLALQQMMPANGNVNIGTEAINQAAIEAAQNGADILITPEMALTGYNIGADKVTKLAGSLEQVSNGPVADIARENQIAMLVGFPELGGNGKIYNTIALIDRSGKLATHYRKTHLYGDVDRRQFSPGEQMPQLFEFEGWKLGLGICYDVEFPEFVRHQALAGADAILVPTANMLPYESVATRLVPARAEENSVYLAYVNYCGKEGHFDYCGLSCVCGPDGNDLARAGREEVVIYADLSKSTLAKRREILTYLTDRRDDIYRL